MKKTMIMLAVLCMTLAMLTALPGLGEESGEPLTEAPVTGEWYANLRGISMRLTFREDGTYSQAVPGREEESAEGTWEEVNGWIYLDGNEDVPLFRVNSGLQVGVTGLRFTREEPAGYVPEAVIPGEQTDLMEFQGAWSSAYVMANGRAVPAEDLGDDTLLYIEGRRAALVGDLFGGMIAEFAYADGAMTLTDEANGISITLQLQSDYRMRMSVRAGAQEMVYILGAYMTEGL